MPYFQNQGILDSEFVKFQVFVVNKLWNIIIFKTLLVSNLLKSKDLMHIYRLGPELSFVYLKYSSQNKW